MEQHTNLKQALEASPNEAKKEQILRMFKKTEMILKEIDRKALEISVLKPIAQ
jgi:hypothetical protein